MKNTRTATVRWTGDGDRFEATSPSGHVLAFDGDMVAGFSPMGSLLASVGACMAIDIRMILEKGRVPLDGLETDVEGERRSDVPRYFERVAMTVRLRGPGPEHQAKIDRAVALSRDKYCSVLHTLRPDLEFTVTTELL